MQEDRGQTTNGSRDAVDRPSSACVTCPPPRGQAWTLADPKHATCSDCYLKLRERLAEIGERYLCLDARPGASFEAGSRGSPGFGSRPPINLHVAAMRDPRSSQDARVWVGSDGRVHAEATRPALSVHGALSTLAWAVAEHRDVAGPEDRADVFVLLRFVDRHIDYITRHADLAVEADRALRELSGVLRPVTGDARRRIGLCRTEVYRDDTDTAESDDVVTDPEDVVADGDDVASVVRCGVPLYAPVQFATDEEIVCSGCGTRWPMHAWIDMMDDLRTAEPA